MYKRQGSALALGLYLQEIGYKPVLYLPEPISSLYKFLPGQEFIRVVTNGLLSDNSAFIAVDCADEERWSYQLPQNSILLNIDHHVSNTLFGEVSLVDSQAAATGEIIYRIITDEGGTITPEIATCPVSYTHLDVYKRQIKNHMSTIPSAEVNRIKNMVLNIDKKSEDASSSEDVYKRQTAKNVILQKIREAERDMIFDEYANRESDIVTGVVQRIENKNVYIDFGKTEAILTQNEQMPTDEYKQNDRIKTYIIDVKKTTKGPQIMVSRTHPCLLYTSRCV